MNDNEIKNAFDEIEPEAGAQERMYANILKKAAAQQEPLVEDIATVRAAAKKQALRRQRWGLLAACFAVSIALGVALPRLSRRTEPTDPPLELVDPPMGTMAPPVLGGSPFEDVDGPEGFAKLGFAVAAPEGAEDAVYCIIDGEIARVRFSLGGHSYIYEAARLDGNFSPAEGEALESISLDAAADAVLERVSPEVWRAHWTAEGVSRYLTNFDGAPEAEITALALALIGQE